MSDIVLVCSKLHCLRCGYEWVSQVEHPKKCAYCKSPLWDIAKQMNTAPRKVFAKDMYSNKLCKCGCGRFTRSGRDYLYGHNLLVFRPDKMGIIIPSKKKGLTYEEYYGKERAKSIVQKLSNDRCGKNYNEIFGAEKTIIIKGLLSKAHLGRTNTWQKGKTIEQIYGEKRAKIIRQKMSQNAIRLAPITSPKKSETMKRKWEYDADYVNKVITAWNVKPNKTEFTLSSIIDCACPNTFGYNGDGRLKVKIGHRIPDFVHIVGEKKVIELFGSYWHEKSEFKQAIDDYAKYGYQCLVIWADDIYRGDNRHEVLRRKIINFINAKGFVIKNGRYYFSYAS